MIKYIKLAIILLAIFLVGCHNSTKNNEVTNNADSALIAQDTVLTDSTLLLLDECFTFMIASDLGRNGYYDQQIIAEVMGEVADIAGVEFVAALGDVHHFMGIQSVNDPLWLSNYELIYKHPELMIPWFPILGNHEYEGNTDAMIAYSEVSRRWQMPARFYSKTYEISDSTEVLLLFIDTAPLIDKYRISDDHPDARKQSVENQLSWLDNTLKKSTAKWKIAMGHHPVYAGTTKSESERTDLQKRLLPILEKYDVDVYYNGHIHNFQHINIEGSAIDYFVISSASQSREVLPLDGTIFSSSATGFALCSLNDSILVTSFIDKRGQIIYQHKRKQ
jgi:hypothetical protein